MRKYIIFIAPLITTILWLSSKQYPLTAPALILLSQLFSLIGLLLMCISLILTTRIKMVETIFGGLDKAYRIHHIIGRIAFVLILAHPLLLAVNVFPPLSNAFSYFVPGSYLPESLGIIAYYIMIFAFLFIVAIKLPYHWWKRTHQLLGLAALFGGMHAFLIGSDMGSYIPLRLWMGFWIFSGWISFFYTFIFYKHIGSVYVYVITRFEKIHNIVSIYAKPKRRSMVFLPGQFAYVTVESQSLSKEQHPFSFSSAPHEEELRISAKMLGDYTKQLHTILPGELLYLKGPYGTFGEPYKHAENIPLVWVMGGIGATPFLSMLRDYVYAKKSHPIYIYYVHRSKQDGVFLSEFKALSKNHSSLSFHDWQTSEKRRIQAHHIHEEVLKEYSNYTVQLCGPELMMRNLAKQFASLGIPKKDIYYESFAFLK